MYKICYIVNAQKTFIENVKIFFHMTLQYKSLKLPSYKKELGSKEPIVKKNKSSMIKIQTNKRTRK